VCHKLVVNAALDCVLVPLWVHCAGNVLRAGLAQFPDSAYLNIQLGSFEAVLRQEPSVGDGRGPEGGEGMRVVCLRRGEAVRKLLRVRCACSPEAARLPLCRAG
jgi:hypothetical protein